MSRLSPARSLYELFEHSARLYPQHPAITLIQQLEPLRDQTLDYQGFFAQLNQCIRLLRATTGKERPVVALLVPASIQSYVLLWGASCAGIAMPINPLLNESALAALMSRGEADLLVALGPLPGSELWDKAERAVALMERPPLLMSMLAPGGGAHFDTLLGQYPGNPLPQTERPDENDLAAYFHTGGTTGAPKLACHRHANQLASARAFARSMQLGPGHSILNGLPLFHVAGALATALGALACGVHMVLPTPAGLRNPQVIQQHWRLVEHYRLTVSGGIPTSLASMLAVPVEHDISSLRYLISGGAPVPAALSARARELTGLELYQIYGMTECTGVITMPNLDAPGVPGSAGHVSGEIKVKIDPANGEILVSGPTVFAGYLGQGPAPLEDGWLRSGDLGHLDAAGNLFITGRAKDVIIRSGHNIDPALIENCLEQHPEVMMAAAVSMPDEYAGELPVAFVQLSPGASVSAEALREFAMAHIDERPACPKEVFMVEALPVTAVGKIYKVRLRELAAEHALRQRLSDLQPAPMLSVQQRGDGRLAVRVEGADATQTERIREVVEGLSLLLAEG